MRVISGIILLIVIRCSYCQDFATDAPKDPQFIEGTSTTHEANGAENSPSLGMTVSKMCTLKVLWPFLQRVNSVAKRMVYIALYTSLRWCKKGGKYITEFLSFLVLKKPNI